jgi:transcriptional regulator of acetoin/glycerol metabolism
MLVVARDRATRDYLIALMKDVQGNVTQAAERAGVERESMHRLLRRHGIRSDDYKPRP